VDHPVLALGPSECAHEQQLCRAHAGEKIVNARTKTTYVVKWDGKIVARRTTHLVYANATVTEYDEARCLDFIQDQPSHSFWPKRFEQMKAKGAFKPCVTCWYLPDGRPMFCTARFGVPFGWRQAPYVKWEQVVPVEIEPTQTAIKVAHALARLPQSTQRRLIAMVGDKLIAGSAWDHFAALLAQHLDVKDFHALSKLTALRGRQERRDSRRSRRGINVPCPETRENRAAARVPVIE